MKTSIIAIVFILLFKFSYCQNIEQVITFADIQFGQKNYNLALKEYQRALFFSDTKYHEFLFKKIAEIHFEQKNYAQASTYYDYVYNITKSDSIKNEMIFNKATCYLMRCHYNYAIIELFNFKENLPKHIEQRKQFYLGICYFGIENYLLAAESFLKSIDEHNLKAKKALIEIFSDKKNFFSPNPAKAFLLSLLVPGTGQVYIGNMKDGINSFLINAGLLYLGYSVTVTYTFFDAFIGIFPWWFRYYQGGFTNALEKAEFKRQQNRNLTFQKILKAIEESKINKH